MITRFACRRLSTLAVVFGALLAWAEAQPLRAAGPTGVSMEFRLLDASGQSKTKFKPGDRIQLELKITNYTGSTQTLSGLYGEMVRFTISDAKGEVKVFKSPEKSKKVRDLKLKNGEATTFRMDWKQCDNEGLAVVPGIYQAKMFISNSNVFHASVNRPSVGG